MTKLRRSLRKPARNPKAKIRVLPRCLDKKIITAQQVKISEAQFNGLMRPQERHLQILCLNWLDYNYPSAIYHASPNGANVTVAARNHLWEMGACWGWPDLEIIYAGQIIWIELKIMKRKPDARQVTVHHALRNQGFRVFVVDNYDDFRKAVLDAFGEPERKTP